MKTGAYFQAKNQPSADLPIIIPAQNSQHNPTSKYSYPHSVFLLEWPENFIIYLINSSYVTTLIADCQQISCVILQKYNFVTIMSGKAGSVEKNYFELENLSIS